MYPQILVCAFRPQDPEEFLPHFPWRQQQRPVQGLREKRKNVDQLLAGAQEEFGRGGRILASKAVKAASVSVAVRTGFALAHFKL